MTTPDTGWLVDKAILLKWRDRVQSFCFYWNDTHRRGACRERNGRYCTFCELADEFDKDLREEPSRDHT